MQDISAFAHAQFNAFINDWGERRAEWQTEHKAILQDMTDALPLPDKAPLAIWREMFVGGMIAGAVAAAAAAALLGDDDDESEE